MSKVQEVIDIVKGLTVLELSELVKALEEEFGVSAAAPVAVAAAAPAAAPSAIGTTAYFALCCLVVVRWWISGSTHCANMWTRAGLPMHPVCDGLP